MFWKSVVQVALVATVAYLYWGGAVKPIMGWLRGPNERRYRR